MVQFWSSAEVPPAVSVLMQSWRTQNPSCQCRVFDSLSAGEFIRKNLGETAAGIFQRAGATNQQADLFRLAYLALHGGIYADADSNCNAGLFVLITKRAGLVLYQDEFGALGNGFIASVPRHPVLIHAARLAFSSVARGDSDIPWLSTVPALLTRAFAETMTTVGANWREWLKAATILTRRDVSTVVALQCHAGQKTSNRRRLRLGNLSPPKP